MVEKIEWFYLDWTKYEFGWWWAEYNAWQWIEIKNWTYYSDMQWPAPDGFHVPLITEWQWVKTIMNWLSLTTWDNWRINLHMPFNGGRSYSDAKVFSRSSDGVGLYWSSSPNETGYNGAGSMVISSDDTWVDLSDRHTYGYSVRCFKNSYTVPDSSWTVIQWTLWSAWIFWNKTEWLISITDWTTGYTMMDKNLWATTVYSGWSALSEANCGKYYQWGNNYWFAWNWSVTTSSTQVDASSYWPWNYYSSSTFITRSDDWSSVKNDNLRWWVTWGVIYDNAITNTWVLSVNEQTGNVTIPIYNARKGISIGDVTINWRQWPCPEGFHVPSVTERSNLRFDTKQLSLTTWDSLRINLHIPFAGSRSYYSAALSDQGSKGFYWTSSPYGGSGWGDHASVVSLNSSDVNVGVYKERAYGCPIRAFKDSYAVPDSSWTVIQWTLWNNWIFWNKTEWLISIWNSSAWHTIMDKNLWATTVYNDWDALTQANMWNMYQWWNNYWFPSTWTYNKTSSTQVNASWYWPDNYYESNTFIVTFDSWSSVQNDDLWWSTTWTITKKNMVSNTGVLSVNGQTGDVTTLHVYELDSSPTIDNIQQIHNLVLEYWWENVIIKRTWDSTYVVWWGDDEYILSFSYQWCVERDAHDTYQWTYHSFKSVFYEPYNWDNFILYILWYKTDYNYSDPKAVRERSIKAKKISVT